jgi:hypothetical protein
LFLGITGNAINVRGCKTELLIVKTIGKTKCLFGGFPVRTYINTLGENHGAGDKEK